MTKPKTWIRKREARWKTHGMSHTSTYRIWSLMLHRCLNSNDKRWHRYGGRGICVCERGLKFENFLADMGVVPEGLTLERNNNDGNYEPDNCRWATKREQNNNRVDVLHIEFEGETHTLVGWADKTGIKYGTLYKRLKVKKLPLHQVFATKGH